MSKIQYKTVLETLLPHGSLWRPAKVLEEVTAVGVELITNGTFDTDISGWTNSSTGIGALIQWESPGVMRLRTAPA
ncbi:MAG: hypothetical protein ACYSW3_29330 [Planctomycetota bacterium]|jgi:hypothetical protein